MIPFPAIHPSERRRTMAHSDRGFGGYRGRRTLTDILRLIAIILGVLVVLRLGLSHSEHKSPGDRPHSCCCHVALRDWCSLAKESHPFA